MGLFHHVRSVNAWMISVSTNVTRAVLFVLLLLLCTVTGASCRRIPHGPRSGGVAAVGPTQRASSALIPRRCLSAGCPARPAIASRSPLCLTTTPTTRPMATRFVLVHVSLSLNHVVLTRLFADVFHKLCGIFIVYRRRAVAAYVVKWMCVRVRVRVCVCACVCACGEASWRCSLPTLSWLRLC